jgi:hypothetical protein
MITRKSTLAIALFLSQSLPGYGRIPDEFEAGGGHSLAFGNGGVAAVSGQNSVKTNPAMLAVEKQYTVSGTYHWPSYGRSFYQIGAVDSKTSNLAAGITYTTSKDKYVSFLDETESAKREQAFYDTPLRHRFNLGFGLAYSKLAVGLGIQYVEGYDRTKGLAEPIKGTAAGLGMAGLLTPNLRFGVSGENLVNDRVENLAPRAFRAGLAYTLFEGTLTAHLDYMYRQRVQAELVSFDLISEDPELDLTPPKEADQQEQMVVASTSIKVQDMLRLLASYGHDLSEVKRQSIGGGIALVNQKASLSYMVHQPYQTGKLHHGIALAVMMIL